MQETWKFSLNPQDQPKNPEIILREVLDTNERDLGIFLSYYFKKEGAVAEKVKLKGKIEFLNDLKGKLMLDFDLVHFNACLNIGQFYRIVGFKTHFVGGKVYRNVLQPLFL